jgi:prepilin-type N-terminal cleavage/methylation domain-containing protein
MSGKRAFTLIEVLIASSIFAVVMVALYAAFSSGVFGWRNIEEQTEAYQQARHILGRMNLDLRNSFAYASGDAGFSGSGDKISFFATVDDYQENGFIRNYALVSYYQQGNKLMRLCRRNSDSLNPASEVKAGEIGSGVERISFTYIYIDKGKSRESESCDNAKIFPAAVKVKLVLKKKYAYEFERMIYLVEPIADAQQSK